MSDLYEKIATEIIEAVGDSVLKIDPLTWKVLTIVAENSIKLAKGTPTSITEDIISYFINQAVQEIGAHNLGAVVAGPVLGRLIVSATKSIVISYIENPELIGEALRYDPIECPWDKPFLTF